MAFADEVAARAGLRHPMESAGGRRRDFFLFLPACCRIPVMPAPGSDHASAALRHMRDAEHLIADETYASRDQVWHLAGFAHECARKACVQEGWLPKLLGHDFSSASDAVIEFAIALDPRASRLPVRQWASRYPAVAAWRPDHRYERTGTAEKDKNRNIEHLVKQGREAVDACIVALFLDGSLAMESIR